MLLAFLNIDSEPYDHTDLVKGHVLEDSQDGWYRKYINAAYFKGLMSGTKTGMEPNRTLTRAEAATLVFSVTGVFLDNDRDEGWFPNDVTADRWYFKYINAAARLGLVHGVDVAGNRVFQPTRTVTRAEFVTMLHAADPFRHEVQPLKDDSEATIAGTYLRGIPATKIIENKDGEITDVWYYNRFGKLLGELHTVEQTAQGIDLQGTEIDSSTIHPRGSYATELMLWEDRAEGKRSVSKYLVGYFKDDNPTICPEPYEVRIYSGDDLMDIYSYDRDENGEYNLIAVSTWDGGKFVSISLEGPEKRRIKE